MAVSILHDHATSNTTGYSVQEDATPLDPSDTTGGVGQIDYEGPEVEGPEGSVQLSGLDIEISDPNRGKTTGNVNSVDGSNGIIQVSADGRLVSLVGTVSAKPMVDTLQAVVLYYLSLGGITEGIYIDSSIAYLPVAVPGFNDDLWLHIKQLVAVHGCEIALVGNKVVVRPVRSFASNTEKKTDFKWSVGKGDTAQFVEVTYYENSWVDNQIVYPYTDDERSNAQTWEVAEGTTLEDDVNLSISLSTIQQPTAQPGVRKGFGDDDEIGQNEVIQSVFSVYDTNNELITPQTWNNLGGAFEVTINPDTTSIHVKITAPEGAGASPYKIVGRPADVPDDPDYPSFFLVGSGVFVNPIVLRVPTGVSPGTSATEVGETAQVSAVATLADAYTTALALAKSWTGTNMEVSGTLTSVNRINSNGAYTFPPFSDFDAEYANQTFSAWNAQWNGKTFKDFADYELSKLADNPENQTFGNVAGARLKYKDAMYRVSTATISNENITFTAKSDTTIGDFSTAFAGKTIADFNKRFAGKSFKQFDRIPLTTKDSTGTIYVPPGSGLPYPDTFYPDQLYPDQGGTPDTVGTAAPDTFYPDQLYPA